MVEYVIFMIILFIYLYMIKLINPYYHIMATVMIIIVIVILIVIVIIAIILVIIKIVILVNYHL